MMSSVSAVIRDRSQRCEGRVRVRSRRWCSRGFLNTSPLLSSDVDLPHCIPPRFVFRPGGRSRAGQSRNSTASQSSGMTTLILCSLPGTLVV